MYRKAAYRPIQNSIVCMIFKKHVPRLFLILGSAFIFLSIFLVWAIITNIMSGEHLHKYGYDQPVLYIIFIISLTPVILLEVDIKFAISFILIPLFEFIMLAAAYPLYIGIYAVETGIGMYIAGLGILFQFIGIIMAVLFQRLNKELMFYSAQYEY
jgi:hypothetical protein